MLIGTWQFPPDLAFKLNFDAEIFSNLNCSGMGAIIRNGKGEIMEAMFTKGPLVRDSENAEILACRKVMEFAIDAGFTDLVIEGDNATVMNSISTPGAN